MYAFIGEASERKCRLKVLVFPIEPLHRKRRFTNNPVRNWKPGLLLPFTLTTGF